MLFTVPFEDGVAQITKAPITGDLRGPVRDERIPPASLAEQDAASIAEHGTYVDLICIKACSYHFGPSGRTLVHLCGVPRSGRHGERDFADADLSSFPKFSVKPAVLLNAPCQLEFSTLSYVYIAYAFVL